MAAEQVSELGRFVKRVCNALPDYRGSKISYPVGLLVLGFVLAECAGRLTQDSKEVWFQFHWHWIVKLWLKYGGEPPRKKGTPSQSTISRLLSDLSESTFSRLVFQHERLLLWDQWESYLKDESQDDTLKKRAGTTSKQASQSLSIASMARAAPVALANKQVDAKLI